MTEELPSYTIGSKADWSLIPAHMVGGVRLYIEHGVEPGSFLSAVLCNDLRGACECADDINRTRLFQYIQFLHNHAPLHCWGSTQRFLRWMDEGGLLGEKKP